MPGEINLYKKALDYAFRLLKVRFRSSQELQNKLRDKKYPKDLIDKVLTRLKELKLIDDEAFSLLWARSRINNFYGRRRISFELKQKGIPLDLINNALEELTSDYKEIDVINSLIQQRLKRFKNLGPIKAKRRLYSFLKLKGFSEPLINEALSNL